MSFVLHGAAVSGGITIGYAHLVSTARLEVAHYEIAHAEVDAEVVRFDAAIEQVRGELTACTRRCRPTRRRSSTPSSTCTA